jgi:hypothetical protein
VDSPWKVSMRWLYALAILVPVHAGAISYSVERDPAFSLEAPLAPVLLPLFVPDDYVIGLATVVLDLQHERFPDIAASLTSPGGTLIELPMPFGGPSPDTGLQSALPFELTAFGGEASRGLWTLSVQDISIADRGHLGGWTLNLTPAPEPVTVLLYGSGLIGIGWAARRRRNQSCRGAPSSPTGEIDAEAATRWTGRRTMSRSCRRR